MDNLHLKTYLDFFGTDINLQILLDFKEKWIDKKLKKFCVSNLLTEIRLFFSFRFRHLIYASPLLKGVA